MSVHITGDGTSRWLSRMVALIIAALALSPASAGAAPAAQSGDDVSRLAALSGEQFEMEFMNLMIQHHSMAVEMANDVVQRGQHQELKDTAQNIIRDQNREIEEMKGWLQQWYNAQYQPGMMHDTQAAQDMSMMHGLSGDELDKMFLSSMRKHHLGAIEMAKLVPDRAVHDELKQMAQNVISSQSDEISKFESWAMAWYNLDITAGSPGGTMGGTTGGTDSTLGGTMGGEQMGQPGMPRTGGADGYGPVALSLLALLGATALVAGGVWVRRRA
jgi:uncharacterized protein (DUF305 family)